MRVEVRHYLEQVTVEFKLFFTHVKVLPAEFGPFFVGLVLFPHHIVFLFGQVTFVLTVAIVLFKLNMLVVIITMFVAHSIVAIVAEVMLRLCNLMIVGPMRNWLMLAVVERRSVVVRRTMLDRLHKVVARVLMPVGELVLLVRKVGVVVLVSRLLLVVTIGMMAAWCFKLCLDILVVADWVAFHLHFDILVMVDWLVFNLHFDIPVTMMDWVLHLHFDIPVAMMDWALYLNLDISMAMMNWMVSVSQVLSLHMCLPLLFFPELVLAPVLLVVFPV